MCHDVDAQSVLQLTYLMSTGSGSPVVILSVIFSMVTLTMTIAGDDARFLGWSVLGNEDVKEHVVDEDGEDTGEYEVVGQRWGGYKVVMLYVFRVLDIGSTLFLYSLFWFGDQGIITAVLLFLNFVVGVFAYLLLKIKLSFYIYTVSKRRIK